MQVLWLCVEYPHEVPYVLMRSASGLAGSLLIPCIYQVCMHGTISTYIVCIAYTAIHDVKCFVTISHYIQLTVLQYLFSEIN